MTTTIKAECDCFQAAYRTSYWLNIYTCFKIVSFRIMSTRHNLHRDIYDKYLKTINSILYTFDDYIEFILKTRADVSVKLCSDVVNIMVNGKDCWIHVPYVVGTRLWINREAYLNKIITLADYQSMSTFNECWLCSNYIPLSFTVNGTLYTTYIFFYMDHIRIRKNGSNYYNSKNYKISGFYSKQLIDYPYRFITYTSILVRYIKMLLLYSKTMDLKQNKKFTSDLLSGNFDFLISKRAKYQSTAEDNNDDKRNIAGNTISSNRKTRIVYANSTNLRLKQSTVAVMSLAPQDAYITNHRLIFKQDQGVISPSKVTETNRTGQQKYLVCGVEFPRVDYNHCDDVMAHFQTQWQVLAERLSIKLELPQVCIDGYTLSKIVLNIPKSKFNFLRLVLEMYKEYNIAVDVVRNDFDTNNTLNQLNGKNVEHVESIENVEHVEKGKSIESGQCIENSKSIENVLNGNTNLLYIFPNYYTPVVPHYYNPNVKLTQFSIEYFSDTIKYYFNFFSLIDQCFPLYSFTHIPKLLQSITKSGNTVLPNISKNIRGNKVVQYFKYDCTRNLPLMPLDDPIYLPTKVAFKQHTLNDEDGMIVSDAWASNQFIYIDKFEKVKFEGSLSIEYMNKDTIYDGDVVLKVRGIKIFGNHFMFLSYKVENDSVIFLKKKNIVDNIDDVKLISVSQSKDTLTITIRACSKNSISLGDKFTSLHGQKVTITKILPANHSLLNVNGKFVDCILSATSLKRMNIGELLFSNLMASPYKHIIQYCYGEHSLSLKFDYRLIDMNRIVYDLFFIRLTNRPDEVLSISSLENSITNIFSGQNTKGRNISNGQVLCTKGLLNISSPTLLRYMLSEQDLSNRKVYDKNGYCIYSNQSAHIVGENISCSRNVNFQSKPMKRKNTFLSDNELSDNQLSDTNQLSNDSPSDQGEKLQDRNGRKYLKLI